MAETAPLILFGAFDRHNFGDLLFPHIAACLVNPRPVAFAGLAERDLTPHGGHHVHALAGLAEAWGEVPADLLHVGGELLTCTLEEAEVMLLGPRAAHALLSRLQHAGPPSPASGHIAYLAPKSLFQRPGRFLHQALGGVGLDRLAPAARAEAISRLRQSDGLSVRDHITLEQLRRAGIEARLLPDSAVLAAELFGPLVIECGLAGEPAAVRAHFPQGYVACQFSADFGDDGTLKELAGQLNGIAVDTGLGLCLFRAGAAPWHDNLQPYRRLQPFLQRQAWLFRSLNLWDIVALLARSAAYVGSSLHGRIAAEAFARPGANFFLPGGGAKQRAYAETWGGMAAVPLGQLRPALDRALAGGGENRRRQAARWVSEWAGERLSWS